MAVEKLKESVIGFHALKYKAKGFILLIIGIIITIIGLVIIFGNFIVGGIIFLIGIGAIIFGFLSIKQSRYTAEVKAGVHGRHKEWKLREMEKKMGR